MATLTALQTKTMARGFGRQIQRDKDTIGTHTLTVQIEIRSNTYGYAEKQVLQILDDIRLRDVVSTRIANDVVPRRHYEELLSRANDLEDNFNDRLNEKLDEVRACYSTPEMQTLGDDIPEEDYFLTASEAAQRAGVSIATAVRYLDSGWWQGTRKSRGKNQCIRWLVEPNQSFDRKPRKNKRKAS